MKRLCVVCEVMHEPFDEGIRIFAAELSRALAVSQRMKLLLLSAKESRFDGLPIHGALTNRYFLSRELAALIGGFGPEAIVYVPWTSLTARTLVRVGSLRRYAPGATIAVIALQPRPSGAVMRVVTGLVRPDLVLTAGPAALDQAARLGLRASGIVPGVDLTRFGPATAQQRAELRQRAGIDPSSYVVLHVGHMKESRNVGVLADVARLDGVRCVLVASTSTVSDRSMASRLTDAGVMLMTHHQDRIEFAYRLADAYLFPVTSDLDAIETPLSVLEAAACDLTIISTRFGGLPVLLGAGAHWAAPGEMVSIVERLARAGEAHGGTRRLVRDRGWDSLAAAVVGALEAVP